MAGLIIVIVVVALIVGSGMWRAAQHKGRERLNFDWYKTAHPDCFQNNHVTCCHCGSDRINARGLMRGINQREHFCSQCGTTLYYSPEANA